MRKSVWLLVISGWLLVVCASTSSAQAYMDYRGTSADTFRIGNDHWIDLFAGADSLLHVKHYSRGARAYPDTNWVKRRITSQTGFDSTKIGYLAKVQSWTEVNTWTKRTIFQDDSSQVNGLWYDYPSTGRIAGGVLYDSLGNGILKFRKMQPYILTTYPMRRNGDSLVIDFNSTNLKLTLNRLNTIQDIATTATNFTTAGQTLNGNLAQAGNYSIYNNFTSGWAGSGYRLDYGVGLSSKSSMEIDNLTVRGTMSIYELLVRQIRATNGAIFVSASAKVKTVNGTTITFDDESNSNLCPFAAGDLLIVQRFKPDGATVLRSVQATVSSVTGASAVVSYTYGTFQAGDEVVRIGNTTTASRQNSIYLTSDDSNSPFMDMITDVNSWSAWSAASKTKLRIGNLSGVTDTDFGALSGYGLYGQNVYLKGNIRMSSGNITWSGVNKPTQSDLGTWTTYITSSGIYTGTVTLNQLNFTPVQNTDVIAKINASTEGLDISADRISISGTTTFASGYDPSTKTTSGEVTTIIGNTVTTSYLNAKAITALGAVTAGTFSLGSGAFSVDANGKLTSTSAAIAGWDINSTSIYKTNTSGTKSVTTYLNSNFSSYTTGLLIQSYDNSALKLNVQAGSYNDGGAARYGFAIWDNVNSKFLMNIGYGGTGNDMVAKLSGLTVEGNILSSSFSSTSTLDSTSSFVGSILNTNGLYERGMLGGSYIRSYYGNGGLRWYQEGYYTNRRLEMFCNPTSRGIAIDGYNVPKFYGITDTPPTTNLQLGDFYIGTAGSIGFWTGSQWWSYSHN